jgi:hypothetical protein
MLADGYSDTPLPVVLENFTARWSGASVNLSWQTGSENDLGGFEIDRTIVADTTLVGNAGSSGDTQLLASYWSDDSLRSHSATGATYHYIDASAPVGTPMYELYAITDDGAREWLASQAAVSSDSVVKPELKSVEYSGGSLILSFNMLTNGTVSVTDDIGRVWYQQSFQAGNGGVASLPVSLPGGFYFISCRGEGSEMTKKLLISP